MATDNRKIQIETEVVANTDALQKVKADFKEVAAAAEQSGRQASAGLERIGAGADGAAAKLDRSTKSIVSAVQRTTVAMESGGRSTAEYYRLLAQQRGADPKVLEPYLQKLREIQAAQQGTGASIQQAGRQLDQFGNTAKATAAALRQVPAQFTDIVVSLQGGQAPLTVLLQQGGQLKDVFGGIAPAVQALGGYIKGLISPLTVAAAAAGTLAVGFFKGREEAQEFQKTLILTGNAAGTSSGQLSALATQIDRVVGTQSKAAQVLNQLAAAGNVTAGSFERLATAAIAFERAGGAAAEEVVKRFAELGKEPLAAAIKLNETTNFLTRSTYEQIRALEQQGRTTEAAKVAQDAYAASLEQATPRLLENLGYVERAWGNLKDIVKETGDAILSIGRQSVPETQLDALKQQLANAEALRQAAISRGQTVSGESPEISSLQEQVRLLQKGVDATQQRAIAQREANTALKQQIDFEKEAIKYRTDAQKFAAAELEIRNKYSLAVREGYISEQQLLDLIAAKRKEIFKDTATGSDAQLAQLRGRAKDLDEYLARLKEYGVEADKLTEDEKTRNRLQQELNTNLKANVRAQKEAALAQAEINVVKATAIQQLEAELKTIKESNEEYAKQVRAINTQNEALKQQADNLDAANAAMGKSKIAIQELAVAQAQAALTAAQNQGPQRPEFLTALNEKVIQQERILNGLRVDNLNTAKAQGAELLRNATELEKAYSDELRLSGLTALEQQKITVQRQINLKYAKELAELEKRNLPSDQFAVQKQVLDEAKFRETSAAINKVVQDDFIKTADQINQSLTDALMRGFENGKDFAQNLKDTIINMFKTMVLRPVVQAIVNPLALTLTSALGGSSAANAAGTDALSQASSFSSALNLLNTGVSTAIANSFGKLASSSFGQSVGLTTPVAGPVSSTGQAATQFTSTGQSISAGLGMAGNALAGYGIQKAISGGYKTGESGLVDAITVAASAYFGPIAGVVAGVFNRAFGRKLADLGVTGEFGGTEGFQGQNFTFEKGGFLRSDRTRTTELDQQFESALSNQFKAIQVQTALMADSLGLGTEAIANFTKDVRLSFMGLTEEQIAQKIEDEFVAINESLASLALGSAEFTKYGETSAQALTRLSSSLLAVNTAFELLGYKLYEIGLQGASAASSVAELFGGVEAFQQAASSYYESFYTDAEKLQGATTQVTNSLAELGLAMPVDKLAYRVEIEKALTAGNEELFASLIKLAPAFAEVSDAVARVTTAIAENSRNAVIQAFAIYQEATNRAFASVERSVKAEAEAAKTALTETYEAQVKVLNTQKTVALAAQQVTEQNISAIRGLFGLLKGQITELITAADAGMTAAQGREFINQAIATARTTGYLPEEQSLATAITAVTSKLDSSNYATAFEQRRDRLLLANQLGDLADLTDDQLTVAEKQLQATKDQLELLDRQLNSAKTNFDDLIAANDRYYAEQLTYARDQLDAARGVDKSVVSVKTAIERLQQAIVSELAAGVRKGTAIQTTTTGQGYDAATDVYRSAAGDEFSGSMLGREAIALAEAGKTFELYAVATQNKITSDELAALANSAGASITGAQVRQWAADNNLPTFADGGYYNGGLALVGERGPELINFKNPGQVYNADQTSTMMGGGVALVDEVRALREDNQAQARAMVGIQARLTKLMERWDANGLPETRAVA